MRITLFGTTTVSVDGNDIVVTAARQRAVLARLALAPGVAVSHEDRSVDWGTNQAGIGHR